MDIEIEVSGHYRWRPATPDEVDVAGNVIVMSEFMGQSRPMIRELVEAPSVTTISVPDEQLDQMHNDHKASGGQMTREQFLARHLEDAVMAHHAPSHHWQAARADHPETHAHLQKWVGQFGGSKPVAPAEDTA